MFNVLRGEENERHNVYQSSHVTVKHVPGSPVAFQLTIHLANHDRLSGTVKAQTTTTLRSQISVEKLHTWHTMIRSVEKQLADLNQPDGTGVDWEDVDQSHFWANLDEENVPANAVNDRMVGEKAKRKHDLNADDLRESITEARIGNAAWDALATAFLIVGKASPALPRRPPIPCCALVVTLPSRPQRIQTGYTSSFLEKHGAAPGRANRAWRLRRGDVGVREAEARQQLHALLRQVLCDYHD